MKSRTRRYAIPTSFIPGAFACFIYQYDKGQNCVTTFAASGITHRPNRIPQIHGARRDLQQKQYALYGQQQ